MGAGQAQAITGLGGDDQRVGGVQAPRDPDAQAWRMGRVAAADGQHAPFQTGDLDVVALVAVLLQTVGIVGHEREAVHGALQPEISRRGGEGETDHLVAQGAVQTPEVVVEGPLAQSFLADAFQVDVGDGESR